MLRRRKHGTTDRLALPHQDRPRGEIAETVRSAPGRDLRMARFIRILTAMARETGREFGVSTEGTGTQIRRLSLTYWGQPVSFGATLATLRTVRDADDRSIHLSGAGFPSGRHG